MSKRWTVREDWFLVEFYDAMGSYIGPHDLGRSEAATDRRVKHLKEAGAWDAYKTAKHHEARAIYLAGHAHSQFDWEMLADDLAEGPPPMKVIQGGALND